LALQGTLDTFSLPDVLRLLATTSKTGRLRIDGDRGRGNVWLSDGGVVDADADRTLDGTPVDEVVFELLRFESGNFAFDGGDTAAAGGRPEDVEALLRRANALLGEWKELEAVVPSLEHEVTLAGDLSADEVTITADSWQSLVAVSSGRTVGELATTLGLTELGVSRAVRDLVELGVVDVRLSDRPRPTAAPAAMTSRDDVPRRSTARPDTDSVAVPDIPAPPTDHPPRAGWLAGDRTGEMPTPVPDPGPLPARKGDSRRADEPATAATPPAAPEPAPPKGGLASRLGRNRNGAGARGADATPPAGSPTVANGTRISGRPPVAPTARTNDAGPAGERPGDTDRPARPDTPVARRPDVARPATPPGAARPGPLGTPPVPPAPAAPDSPFADGRLGPPPRGRDTGQIRPVSPSSLPPDLHWAADDTVSAPVNGGPSSPFSGLSSLGPSRPGPSRPGPSDGEVAPHVAAMSPEARSAVQATAGNAGGSTGARGGSQGEDIAQRGRLISFLSTVR
jgi:Domain of unknown function (DUF4388)